MIYNIIHLLCYVLMLFPAFYVSTLFDYQKVFKLKNNADAYILLIVFGACITYLLAEFAYTIITMFM